MVKTSEIMAIMDCGVENGVMSGRNGALHCSVSKIGGERFLSTTESSTNHSHGKLQQQGDYKLLQPHLPLKIIQLN